MKIYPYFLLFLLMISCLVPPAPQVNWYAPFEFEKKIIYKNEKGFNAVLYRILDNEKIKIYCSLQVVVLMNKRIPIIDVAIVNKSGKSYTLKFEDICLQSADRAETFCLRNDIKQTKFIEPHDSIYFSLEIPGNKKLKDSLRIKISVEDIRVDVPFFYNPKNRMQTYPF